MEIDDMDEDRKEALLLDKSALDFDAEESIVVV